MFIDYLETPLGLFEIMATEQSIVQAIFSGEQQKKVIPNGITEQSKQELTEYFYDGRQSFSIPISPTGTSFQQSVWQCLSEIPFGTVKSYGDIAKLINKPKAAQAVGGANGRNPITLIVPCHRVIGGNGSLTGYAGGLERKLWLLKHEGVNLKNADDYQGLNIEDVTHQRQSKTRFLR